LQQYKFYCTSPTGEFNTGTRGIFVKTSIMSWRYDIQHNHTQHKGYISDSQHKWHSG